MARNQGISSAIYSMLLFAPFGFWVLGVVIGLKALRTRDIGLFKKEIKNMFYYKNNQ